METEIKNWGVVGGGILGMQVALQLAENGHAVTLYESGSTLGGLASSWQINDVTWDRFYHVILLSDTYTRQLIEVLDLAHEMQWVQTKTGFYTGGMLHSMSNTIEFLKFNPLTLLDKLRLGFTIYYASKIKNWKKLENVPVDEWLKKLSGNNTFEKIWLPLLRAKLGENYKKTSAAFIWATIQRMYAARNSGLKKEMFGYARGGYATIFKAFEEKLIQKGIQIKTNAKLKQVNAHNGRVHCVFENGSPTTHDEVILTIPSAFIPGIVQGLPEIEKAKHRAIEYLGVICTSVLMKKAISPYYVTNITDSSVPFTGIIEMTALVSKTQLGGKHLVYLPKYVGAADPLFDAPDEQIEQRFTEALLSMYPHLQKDDILAVKTARARQVFALPTMGYSEKLPAKKTALPGVWVINSAHITNGTLNVNETLKLAMDAVHEILTSSR